MQEDEVWVDKYAYTTAIHAAGQLGKWARCVRYLDEMDSNGVAKDVVTVSVAISACADKGQWAQVRCYLCPSLCGQSTKLQNPDCCCTRLKLQQDTSHMECMQKEISCTSPRHLPEATGRNVWLMCTVIKISFF